MKLINNGQASLMMQKVRSEMIKAENGTIEIKGTIPTICTDLTCIIKRIHTLISENMNDKAAHDLVMKSMELALKSDEEVIAENEKCMNLLKMILEGRM